MISLIWSLGMEDGKSVHVAYYGEKRIVVRRLEDSPAITYQISIEEPFTAGVGWYRVYQGAMQPISEKIADGLAEAQREAKYALETL